MGADADAHIVFAVNRNANGTTGSLRCVFAISEQHIKVIAAFFQLDTAGRGEISLNLVSGGPLFVAILQ